MPFKSSVLCSTSRRRQLSHHSESPSCRDILVHFRTRVWLVHGGKHLLWVHEHRQSSSVSSGARGMVCRIDLNKSPAFFHPSCVSGGISGCWLMSWFHWDAWRWAFNRAGCNALLVGDDFHLDIAFVWTTRVFPLRIIVLEMYCAPDKQRLRKHPWGFQKERES